MDITKEYDVYKMKNLWHECRPFPYDIRDEFTLTIIKRKFVNSLLWGIWNAMERIDGKHEN